MKKLFTVLSIALLAFFAFVPTSSATDESTCYPEEKNRFWGGCKSAEGFRCCPGSGGITIIVKL